MLIRNEKLIIEKFPNKKNFWFDAGDAVKVHKISNLIKNYEKKNKKQVANLDEIALLKRLIKKKKFLKEIKFKKGSYYEYLKKKYEN